jgi:hypothetical protein
MTATNLQMAKATDFAKRKDSNLAIAKLMARAKDFLNLKAKAKRKD